MIIRGKKLNEDLKKLWEDIYNLHYYSDIDSNLVISSIEITAKKTILWRKNNTKFELLTSTFYSPLFETSIKNIVLTEEEYAIQTDLYNVIYSYDGNIIRTEEV
jgi:hypothetical protein